MKKPAKHHTDQATSDDAALFRAAVGAVTPLTGHDRVVTRPARRKPVLRRHASPVTIPDTLSDFSAEQAPDEYLRNGLSRMALRKLRRGTWPVQGSLDLHGNNSDAARKLLQEFLHLAVRQEMRCVLVIHGKGLNSQGGTAVLRKLTRHWLTQHPHVLGYCDAPPAQGGSGAVLVLLKIDP